MTIGMHIALLILNIYFLHRVVDSLGSKDRKGDLELGFDIVLFFAILASISVSLVCIWGDLRGLA